MDFGLRQPGFESNLDHVLQRPEMSECQLPHLGNRELESYSAE